jgi:hypothetical protein
MPEHYLLVMDMDGQTTNAVENFFGIFKRGMLVPTTSARPNILPGMLLNLNFASITVPDWA